MKFMKYITALITFTCAANSYAGFFSSSDEFKCGRDDAVKALQQYIRDGASEMLQHDSIQNAKILLNKPVNVYSEKMNSITVDVKGASTIGTTSPTEVSCKAKVSILLPQESIDVIHAIPEQIARLQSGQESFYNNAVIWKDYSYNLKLSDDKKDISVTDLMKDSASSELYFITLSSVNKNELIDKNNDIKIKVAQNEYNEADTELNILWKNMPDSIRASMKSSQLAWVKDKAVKCGKISDATGNTADIATKVNIFNCQTKMTNERITILGGGN